MASTPISSLTSEDVIQQAKQEFADVLRANGLVIRGSPEMDGKFHSVPVEGSKPGKKPGSYRGFLDGIPSGTFKNWKTGDEGTWKLSTPTKTLTAAEREQLRSRIEREQREKDLERLRLQDDIASYSEKRWNAAEQAPDKHPYLSRKGVSAPGIRVNSHDHLLVPLRDSEGKIWSLQTISPEGEKHFIKGGRMQGLSATLGTIQDGQPFVVTEGLATAATIHQSTGLTTVIAFNAGNLEPVAEALHARYPNSDMIVAADNDHHLARQVNGRGEPKKNVGVEKGLSATQAVKGALVVPEFPRSSEGTDWNDYDAEHGPAGVREAFATQLRIQGRDELANSLLSDLAVQQTNEVTMIAEAETEIATKPMSFGATNTEALYRDESGQTAAQFDVKEGGIYQINWDGKTEGFHVVPEPGLQLTANYVKTEGFRELFETPGIELDGEAGIPLEVVQPALVENHNGEWFVLAKGEVAAAGRSNENAITQEERQGTVLEIDEQTNTEAPEAKSTPTLDELEERAARAEQQFEVRRERMLDALLVRVETAEAEFSRQEARKQSRTEPEPEQPKTPVVAPAAEKQQAMVAEQRENTPTERITVRGIVGQMGQYVQQSLNDAREYYKQKIVAVGAILAPPLGDRPDHGQSEASSKYTLTADEYRRATEQANETQAQATQTTVREQAVSRNVPEQSWHKEAAELVERVAKLETALFPGAAVVTMDPASWAATAKSLDAHISKVEDALGLAPERQEQRELDREEEKAMAKVLKAIGYENSELSPQEKVALVRELMQEYKDLQKIGMHSTVAWESAAAEILDRKTAEPDVVAAPKTAAAVNTPERSKATPQRSKDREENYGRAWMHQQGGYDSLPEELKQSAEKSYKEWSERHPDKAESFGLNDYVAYTQDREGQRHEQEPVQSPKRNVADSSTRKQRLRSMKSFRGTTPAIARSRGGQQLDHEHSHCDRRNQLPPA